MYYLLNRRKAFRTNTVNVESQLFDGTDDVIHIPRTELTGDWLISAWVKTSANSEYIFATNDGTSGSTAGVRLLVDATGEVRGSTHMTTTSSSQITSTTQIDDGTLYNVIYTRVGDDFELYINGSSEATGTLAGTINTASEDWRLGGQYNGSTDQDFWNGDMSTFIVLEDGSDGYADFITELQTRKQPWQYSRAMRGLMTCAIPLNIGVASGREFEDFSGNENDGTTNGGMTAGGGDEIAVTTSVVRTTYDFDGTDDYIDCGNDASLQLTSAISVSQWVMLDTKSADQFFVNKWNTTGNQRGWALEYSNGDDAFVWKHSTNGTNINNVVGTTSPSTGVWYHICGTYDGTTARVYVNKTEENSSALGNIHNSTANVLIGGTSGGTTSPHDGKAAVVQIFDRGLSAVEVEDLYNQNLPRVYAELPDYMTDSCKLSIEMTNASGLTDQSGTGNDGTANGGVTTGTDEIDFDVTTFVRTWAEHIGDEGFVDVGPYAHNFSATGATIASAAYNGRDAFRCDGTNDYFGGQGGTLSDITNQEVFECFMVVYNPTTNAFTPAVSWNEYSDNSSYEYAMTRHTSYSNGTVVNLRSSGNTNEVINDTSDVGANLHILHFWVDGLDYGFRVDNDTEVTGSRASKETKTNDTITYGALVRTANPTGTSFGDYDYTHILWNKGKSTEAERSAKVTELANLYGITL